MKCQLGVLCLALSLMPLLARAAVVSDYASLFAVATPTAEELDAQRYRNSLAYLAPMLCSAVFVSKRDPEEALRNDLRLLMQDAGAVQHDTSGWKNMAYEVDRKRNRVQVWAAQTGPYPATPRFTAVFSPGLGCTLLPVGAQRTSFEPPDARSTLPPAKDQAWPAGDRDAVGTFALDEALDFAFEDPPEQPSQKTRAVVVVFRDKIIAERYAPGFSKDTPLIGWSMGKSVAAALLGIAVKEYGIDVKAPAEIDAWQGRGDARARITPQHLLWMSAGLRFNNGADSPELLYTDFDDHNAVYFRGQNTESFVVNQPLRYPPGTVYQYRNVNPLVVMSIIKRKNRQAGENHLTWPRRVLFDRIGARSFTLEPDAFGNFVITGYDYATARDWARLGLLFLHDGAIDGQRLWPQGWATFLSTPSPTNPEYGGLVWLNSTGRWADVPQDAYAFSGYLGQTVLLIPSREMVVVRLGFSQKGFDVHFNHLMARILAAVEK